MRKNQRISKSEAKAIAGEEKRKMEQLDELGLCRDCELSPQNPALPQKVCLDCFENSDIGGCMVSGCPNSADGSFKQARLCEVHLIDTIHDQYENYNRMVAGIEADKKELFQKAEELGINLENLQKPWGELSPDKESVIEKYHVTENRKRNADSLKNEIKKAIQQVEKAFPEGYDSINVGQEN